MAISNCEKYGRISYLFIVTVISCLLNKSEALQIEFLPSSIEIQMGNTEKLYFNVTGIESGGNNAIEIEAESSNPAVVEVIETSFNSTESGSLELRGNFLGKATLTLRLPGQSDSPGSVEVIVTRTTRAIDTAFTVLVVILVSLLYINFGCATDWSALRSIVKRPVGPLIGILGQFVVMPTISYLVGYVVFTDDPVSRLGLLFTGVSPAGGASNVWTAILDGNIDLSIATTSLNTLAAFAMIPLWMFTLAPHVFEKARLTVPYSHIAALAAALLVPLSIGWLLQRKAPKLAALLARWLKTLSSILVLLIIIFAIVSNYYLFQLLSWRIALAGLLLPWCGYLLGWFLALLGRLEPRDRLAIAVETGVQNTGIAIFMLRFGLPQPEADQTTIVPVAVAVMTPLPLFLIFLWNKISTKNKKEDATISEV